MNKLFLSIVLVATLCSTVLADHDPAWNDFRGSFLIGTTESFAPFPTHLNHTLIRSQNWVLQSGNDCSNGGIFNGYQYVKQNDYSVGLLFDVNGVIAGIQMLIPKKVVLTPTNTLNYNAIPMYQNATYGGQDYFVLTTYVIDPATVCTTGRNVSSLDVETGTGLWLQNGTSITQVPKHRPESDNEAENDGWTKNNCFPGMGFHNFYAIQHAYNTNCTEVAPIFAIYNKRSKQLHGFGFITVGNLTNPRFEKPPEAAIRMILGGKVAQCVVDIEKREVISSLHVYFVEEPWKIGCPIIETSASYIQAVNNWIRDRFFG